MEAAEVLQPCKTDRSNQSRLCWGEKAARIKRRGGEGGREEEKKGRKRWRALGRMEKVFFTRVEKVEGDEVSLLRLG